MKAAQRDKKCVRSRKKRQESVRVVVLLEEQRNQQLKMVLTIAQGEGAEFQHLGCVVHHHCSILACKLN